MAPIDYLATTARSTSPPGETTKQVTVLVNGDLLDEANETFFLNLSNAANATIADGQGLGTITNDDGQPSLSVNDVTVTEGDSGTTSATFTVTLAPASGQNVSVDYSTADGTATAPADYAATSGTLTFAPGQTTRTVTVLVAGDLLDEANETYFVNLSNPSNATIADGQGLGTITDDDALPALSINDVTVTEGDTGTVNATFTVSLSAASACNVSVDFATADGTATAPADYTSASGTLSFTPGQTSKQVTVQVKGDLLDEANETYFVNLTNPTNATIADNQGLGTITDNDPLPSLSINDVTVTEGNTGTVAATYTVTLGAVSGRTGHRRLRDGERNGAGARRLPGRQRHAHLHAGPDDEAAHRPRQRRPAGRGERDVRRQPLQPGERDHRRRRGCGHDHRRRRPLPALSVERRGGDRGRRGNVQRDLHRHPRRAERSPGHRRLRDSGRNGPGARRLPGAHRIAHLRRRADVARPSTSWSTAT